METPENTYLHNLEKLYKKKIASYEEKLKAVKILLSGDEEVNTPNKTIKPLILPESFDKCNTQDLQVFFGLNVIKKGYYQDVAASMIKCGFDKTIKDAERIARAKLSVLKSNGNIDGERDETKLGQPCIYKIKGVV